MTPIEKPQSASDHDVKSAIDSALTKRLLDNVHKQLQKFKVDAFAAGRVIPEAAALVLAGDQHIVQAANNHMNGFLDALPHTLSSCLHGKLLCTISPKKKKLDELEVAERQVYRLKAEIAALPDD